MHLCRRGPTHLDAARDGGRRESDAVVWASVVLRRTGQGLQLGHIEAIEAPGTDRVAVALDREQNPTTTWRRKKWLQQLAEAGLAVSDSVWEGD